jgi:hypothetical protein
MDILSNVKQDFLSFPLLILLFLIALRTAQEKYPKKENFIAIHAILALLLFIGYIAYFQGLLVVSVLTVYFYKRKDLKYLLILQSVIVVYYIIIFGAKQLVNNLTRFTWLKDCSSSFVSSVSKFMFGVKDVNFATDITFIIFVAFLVWGIASISLLKKKHVAYGMLVVASFIITLAFISRSFVMTRYVAFLYLILSIFWGWGVEVFINKYKKFNLLFSFIILFLIFNLALSSKRIIFAASGTESLNNTLQENTGGEKTGFIVDHPTEAFIYKVENKLVDEIVPFNVFSPNLTEKDFMNQEALMEDGKYIAINLDEVSSRFKKKGLKRYLYLFSFRNEGVYFDPDHLVLKVLTESCDNKVLTFPNNVSILYLFKDCNF